MLKKMTASRRTIRWGDQIITVSRLMAIGYVLRAVTMYTDAP